MNKGKRASAGAGDLATWLGRTRGQIETTLTAMLERAVTLSFEPPQRLRSGDYERLLPDGPVGFSLSFGETGGGWHQLLPRSLAAALADLAAMGDGSAPFDEEVHPGTLQEVWGQVAAGLEPELVGLLGEGVEIAPPETALAPDALIAQWGGDPAVVWTITVENWGEGRFVQLFERGFTMHFDAPSEPESEPDAPRPRPQPKSATASTARGAPPRPAGPVARPAAFEDFGPQAERVADSTPRNIDSLLDISLPITIELGRTKMLIREVLDLGPGSVIELDKMSGEPVDLFVNDKKFARGEVVVIEENFGVRITELLKVDERLKALR